MNREYSSDWYNSSKTSGKFYMVVGSGNQPKIRHPDKVTAANEAERLAKANPGSEFYVLEAVSVSVANDVTTYIL